VSETVIVGQQACKLTGNHMRQQRGHKDCNQSYLRQSGFIGQKCL
jgi:hypothetical protein